jgi:hypothetical protein
MRGAFREGLSASRFIRDMREAGLSYRRGDMYADWRNISKAEEKKDLMQYVRSDRYPTEKIIATTTYDLDKEFMYTVNVKSRIRPDEPVTEHLASIQWDVPLTPAMVIEHVLEERAKEEKYKGEVVVGIVPLTVYRRVEE